MNKYCCVCMKKLSIFSKTYCIDGQVFCSKCAIEFSKKRSFSQNFGWYSQEDIYYSGVITESGVRTNLALTPVVTDEELENKFKKINALPSDIKNKILEIPQIKIFFKREKPLSDNPFYMDTPYCVTQNDPTEKVLPKINGEYYDPIKDTEAYKLVINGVRTIANQRYKEHMIKYFGSEYVLGGIHIYYTIEAQVLYDKYGINCVNNPMSLNHDLYID